MEYRSKVQKKLRKLNFISVRDRKKQVGQIEDGSKNFGFNLNYTRDNFKGVDQFLERAATVRESLRDFSEFSIEPRISLV